MSAIAEYASGGLNLKSQMRLAIRGFFSCFARRADDTGHAFAKIRETRERHDINRFIE